MEEDQFQGAGETEQRHDSFDQQPPTYNQKWDEEDDWEAEQREEDGMYVPGNYVISTPMHISVFDEQMTF